MSLADQIKQKLEKALEIDHIEVINESHKHAGHAGDDGSGESHFHLIVLSQSFVNQSRIQRQRTINTILKTELQNKIHALSMKLLTPQEYNNE